MQQPQRLQLLSAVVVVRMIGTSFPMLLRRMMTMLMLLLWPLLAQAAPLSKPFISYRTDPYDQTVHHSIDWEHLQLEQQANEEKVTPKRQRPYLYDEIRTEQCPFQFIIGFCQNDDAAQFFCDDCRLCIIIIIIIIVPSLLPTETQSATVATITHCLDLYSPGHIEPLSAVRSSSSSPATTTSSTTANSRRNNALQEVLVQGFNYPLLFESSIFTHLLPILYDVRLYQLLLLRLWGMETRILINHHHT